MSVAHYFSRLRDLWDEYDAIMPCPGCPWPESMKFSKHNDYQRLLQFLMGLNESYSQPRSRILMMSPILTLTKAYALLVDQESQINLVSSSPFHSTLIEAATIYSQKGPQFNNGASSSKSSYTGSYSGSSSS